MPTSPFRFRGRSLAAILVALAAGVPGSGTAQAAEAPATAGPAAVAGGGGTFLRFLRTRGPERELRAPPKLFVSFGGRRIEAVMDTGSTGLVVAADMIPGWESLPSPGPARLTYSSSGRVMEGRWVVTAATIAGRGGEAVQTRPLPVMAVTRISCLPRARDCTPQERPRHVAMMGIGFARQGDHQAQSTPDHNPFLRLTGMGADGVAGRPGYVVTREGVQVGLGRAEDYLSFRTVRLARSSSFADWAAAPVCISVANHTPLACGTVLVDTGVSRMFLTVPQAQLEGAVTERNGTLGLRPGTPVGVQLSKEGDPPWGYSFRAGDREDARAPRGITLVGPQGTGPGERPTFMNTSLHFLNGFDYLYDADQGLVGYRARN